MVMMMIVDESIVVIINYFLLVLLGCKVERDLILGVLFFFFCIMLVVNYRKVMKRVLYIYVCKFGLFNMVSV